jgi:hypothetical protein
MDSVARPPVAAARDTRAFYPEIAAAALLLVFAAFAPRYGLTALPDAPRVRPLVHVHGLVAPAVRSDTRLV